MSGILSMHPILQTLLATLFTWGITALGAAMVLFFTNVNKKLMDCFMGFAGGVMLAASFWSLLAPAIALCEEKGSGQAWVLPALSFFAGGAFIVLADVLFEKFTENKIDGRLKRSILVGTAVTLHNFPEGMVVGVAFASGALSGDEATVMSAVALAIGIGLQNFPEGASVALPLRRDGLSPLKSFYYGQMSGIVEPIGGLIGVMLALRLSYILPVLLSFSAGTMVAVAAVELIPEASKKHKNVACIAVILGFIAMMSLDIALS